MLRQAITENWAPPVEPKTTDVGSSLGGTFAAHFYAGYHGNSGSPVSEASVSDAEVAQRFVERLLQVSSHPEEVPTWGRQFGELVAYAHGQKRQSLPALRLAIQRHGDHFYSRFKDSIERVAKRAVQVAHQQHYEKFQGAYQNYLKEELARHEAQNSALFQMLLHEENEKLRTFKSNRFGLNVEQLCAQYLGGRLERFQQMVILEEGHGVLDFWAWDKERNADRFRGVSL
jgi:hypothetical protein